MDKKIAKKFFDRENILFFIVTALLLIISFGIFSAEKSMALSVDVSSGKVYTLTEDTKEVLNTLKTEVNIYPINFPGNQFSTTIEVARKFTRESAQIHLKEYTDHIHMQVLLNNASFMTNKTGLLLTNDDFSIMKFIPESDLYDVDIKGTTLSKAEGKILSAIEGIAKGASSRVLLLFGHNETTWANLTSFLQLLKQKNFETDTYSFNGLSTELNPATDLLLIVSPKTDLSDAELISLNSFMNNGGRAIFFMDNTIFDEKTGLFQIYINGLDNFSSLFEQYGLQLHNNILLSNDPAYINLRSSSLLVSPQAHKITQELLGDNKHYIRISEASSISHTALPGVTFSPLLTTDPSCYARPLSDSLTSFSQSATDEVDSFVVAATAEKQNGSALTVFSDSSCLENRAFSISGNRILFESCVDQLAPLGTSTSIASKPLSPVIMQNGNSIFKLILTIIFIGALPLLAMYIGIAKHVKYKLHT